MDSEELLRPFAVARVYSVPIQLYCHIKQLLTHNLQPDYLDFFLVLPALDFAHRIQFCLYFVFDKKQLNLFKGKQR